MDDAETNRRFAESLDVDYPILSDPDKKVSGAYGVLNTERGMAFRWTFYIDMNGIVKHIDREVKTANHGDDMAQKLAELGFPKSD